MSSYHTLNVYPETRARALAAVQREKKKPRWKQRFSTIAEFTDKACYMFEMHLLKQDKNKNPRT